MKFYQNEHKCHALCGIFDKGMMLLKARIASHYSCAELQRALDQTQCNPHEYAERLRPFQVIVFQNDIHTKLQ